MCALQIALSPELGQSGVRSQSCFVSPSCTRSSERVRVSVYPAKGLGSVGRRWCRGYHDSFRIQDKAVSDCSRLKRTGFEIRGSSQASDKESFDELRDPALANGEGADFSATKRVVRNSDGARGEAEAGAGELQNISLPIIGEIPLTRKELSMFTPMKLAVWVFLGTLLYSVWSFITSITIFNPMFLMYSTWILVKWPWPAAISVGIATLVTAFRSSKRQPKEWEQVLLLLGSLTWLILVPNGLYSGFVDGWPLVLYALYSGFFVISAVVRYRLYGDLASKDEDKQWETYPSRLWQIGFVICVVLGHWLAAYEAPFLFYTWNLEWKTIVAIMTLALSVVTHYTASYFLGKYFDRLVRPRAVVMFGPYRFVRHPIYSSYMLLFAGYCLALRSYKSLLFITSACILYYEQRTKLEEGMLAGFFGELYESYREKVKHKYFPLIY